ncbi:MAG: tRNA (adenosine(37)-N6)-threonylcarbamoyltransferase complex transferase subunit TsaD, partial [SAR324 cluster bacterium]|nr:tRNA (adenosine(37)-N6)-threonylcarbamoyltransferase complex transferase subunit TsaD [SAR324 cluster bacterium]
MNAIGLGLDTTFDDTSAAILRGTREVLANLTLSQYRDHKEFGGVVPERASRKHLEVIHPLIREALAKAELDFADLDYIAVSNLPGLLGSLLVGVTVAKGLAWSLDKPLIGVNHVESHPYANILASGPWEFPVLHLVVAGGHTLLLRADGHFDYTILGRTVDDAAGECVDKVAKMFGHPMPGGPVVDRYALEAPDHAFAFPRPLLNKPGLEFSFSGLKTAMLRFREENPDDARKQEPAVLSSFFQAVVDVLVKKTFRALDSEQLTRLTVSGGLAASQKLRKTFESECTRRSVELFYPPPSLC